MKIIVSVLIMMMIFSVNALAQESGENLYSEQYGISGAEELNSKLPDETKDFLDKNGISPSSPDWVGKLTDKNVFRHIFDFVVKGAHTPIKAGVSVLGIVIIGATINYFTEGSATAMSSTFAVSLSVLGVLMGNIWATVSAAVAVIKGSATFMLSFVPIFASIVALSGGAVTSVSMGVLLIGAAQLVVSMASGVILPMMGGYLGIGICESVSPLIGKSGIGDSVKKISMWLLSFVSTVFTGILGIQTVVNASADSLSLKTAKFIIGTSVPVAGATISEAISTVSASLSTLRASVGIYGVFALGLIMLPIVFELIL